MNKPIVISFGEVLWDLFPDGERFGGAPANFACHASLEGAQAIMVSAVGDDQRGVDAIRMLNEIGVDTSLVQVVSSAPTGTVSVQLDTQGKPAFTIHEGSAADLIAWNESIARKISDAGAIYFGTLGQRSEIARKTIRRAAELAAKAGIARVLDINLRSPFFDSELIRESISLASILKLSDDELATVCAACGIPKTIESQPMLRGLLEFGNLDMVILTRGAQGATLVTADDSMDQEGIPAVVIDTVGAGDSFTAAFLIGELQGKPRKDSLRRACEVASATCSHSGAVPARQ